MKSTFDVTLNVNFAWAASHTASFQTSFKADMSVALRVPPSNIEILSVKPGSVHVTFEVAGADKAVGIDSLAHVNWSSLSAASVAMVE